MRIGYIRVSTIEQNEARQVEAMEALGVEKIFQEKISGAKTKNQRPQLNECIEYAREGDVLYVESISRLGRNTIDLLNTVNDLKNKKVGFISLKEDWCNTTSPQGLLIFTIFASLAQFEREQSRQRQLEGIAIAKQEGKYKGRAKKNLDSDILFNLVDAGTISVVDASKQLGISRSTFYRRKSEI